MAITQHTVGLNTANVGTWNAVDVICQLERGFAWAGMHDPAVTGITVGFSSFYGGGYDVTKENNYTTYAWNDVRTTALSGIGTGATFNVTRYRGRVSSITLNCPGYGYTGGELIVLAADDIGGTAHAAEDLYIRPSVPIVSVNNAVSYAVTFSNYYDAVGEDRNGAVVGVAKTITIKVGDTLNITNNQTSTAYNINICHRLTQDGAPWTSVGAADTNRVYNVTNQYNTTPGRVTTWRPTPGQEGVYKIKTDSTAYHLYWFDIVVQPADPADITYQTFGSETKFHDKHFNTSSTTYAQSGVLKRTIQSGKKYGTTYTAFSVNHATDTFDNDVVSILAGPKYFPSWFSTSSNYFGGHGYGQRFAGTPGSDIGRYQSPTSSNISIWSNQLRSSAPNYRFGNYSSDYYKLFTGKNTGFQLDLNIYRSSIDPNFVVFSYKAPTKSSTHISNNTFGTFFLHHFTTDLWDLDELFLGGVTQIHPVTGNNTTLPTIEFVTALAGIVEGTSLQRGTNPAFRSAEMGYAGVEHDQASNYTHYATTTAVTAVSSLTYPSTSMVSSQRIYYRDSSLTWKSNYGNVTSDFNAVVKGLPLNGALLPCPYYIPDDFVLIDFNYGTTAANIQQGDTISVSGSEVYTVITASYNNTDSSGRTRGIAFCARTV